jgi:two-component system KDP operon response regulator KdpE
MSQRVLIVEDDPAILHLLTATLDYGGYASDSAGTAVEALSRIGSDAPAVVLVDLGLPDLSGSRLIETIRESSDVPIIVVSGRVDEETKIRALDAGADDFVPKPFLPGELLARIRAALRRVKSTSRNGAAPASAPGPFTRSRQLIPGSHEEKLYAFLKEHAGSTVSVSDIVAAVWERGMERDEQHVRVLVTTLRRKLKARGEPFEIVNERGRGYRLAVSEDVLEGSDSR